jgi:glycosyltransferase involved in cell wall biosynthesis
MGAAGCRSDSAFSTQMIVSFIVPALNEAAFLPRCLGSIRRLRRPTVVSGIEVIVVDTGSRDATPDVAAEYGARVLAVPGARVAAARNAGARAASGHVLAFVDADCELHSEWLYCGGEHLTAPDVAAMGTNATSPAASASWVERSWHRIGYASSDAPYMYVDWLPSFNQLVWREAFDAVGGFDERLVTCEDSDFGFRLSRRYRLVLENRITTIRYRESRTIAELFKKESWRGIGSVQSARLHNWNYRELPSVVVPYLFAIAVVAAIALAASGVTANGRLLATAVAVALMLPALLPIRRGVAPWQPTAFVPCYALSWVYLSARALGVLRPRRLSS